MSAYPAHFLFPLRVRTSPNSGVTLRSLNVKRGLPLIAPGDTRTFVIPIAISKDRGNLPPTTTADRCGDFGPAVYVMPAMGLRV